MLAEDQAPGAGFSVAILSDEQVCGANAQYRNVDGVTDVLSFRDGEDGYLGDIMIAAGRAADQAAEMGHSVESEIQILALHGMLHLQGYDHETDAGEMRAVEDRLRRAYRLPGGLIDRSLDRSAAGMSPEIAPSRVSPR